MKLSIFYLLLLFFLSGCESRKLKEDAILQLHKESAMVLAMHGKVYGNYLKKNEAFRSMLKRLSFMNGTEKLSLRLDTLEKKISELGIEHSAIVERFEKLKEIKNINERYDKELESSKEIIVIVKKYEDLRNQLHKDVFDKVKITLLKPDRNNEIK